MWQPDSRAMISIAQGNPGLQRLPSRWRLVPVGGEAPSQTPIVPRGAPACRPTPKEGSLWGRSRPAETAADADRGGCQERLWIPGEDACMKSHQGRR